MGKRKIMVLSAVHKIGSSRRKIYEFFVKRMSRIKEKYGVNTLVVGNEGNLSRGITEDAGLLYLEHENNPVSVKWNAGMQTLREYEPDYVMIMGSDDFISDNLIESYLKIAEDGEYGMFGIIDSYYASINLGRAYVGMCLYWPGYPKGGIIGYARCWKDYVLDAVDWAPWGKERNSGLDFLANKTIKLSGVDYNSKSFSIKEEGWFHIDIKSGGNISSIAPLVRRTDDLNLDIRELLFDYLPADEAGVISDHFESEVAKYRKLKGK